MMPTVMTLSCRPAALNCSDFCLHIYNVQRDIFMSQLRESIVCCWCQAGKKPQITSYNGGECPQQRLIWFKISTVTRLKDLPTQAPKTSVPSRERKGIKLLKNYL